MAVVILPSGKKAKIPDGMSEQEAARYLYDNLREAPGGESDAKRLASKYGFETSGVGQAVGGTAGGLGGAIGGALAGAPLGPIGVIGGAILGGTALGAAGGAAGEAIEAEARGVEGDPLQAAFEEGAYGAIPGVGSLAAKGLARGVGKQAVEAGKGLLERTILRQAPVAGELVQGAASLTDDIARRAGLYKINIGAKEYDRILSSFQKSFFDDFFKTPLGKETLSKLDVKLTPAQAKKLLGEVSDESYEVLEKVFKVEPRALEMFVDKFRDKAVNEMIARRAISASQKTAALTALARGGSLEDLQMTNQGTEYPLGTGPGLL